METGFININKPQDWTSFDVVAKLRGITKIKKIGHCGTLDPLATGVLIVAIGRESTKKIDQFHQFKKTYIADLEFGKTSDTYDIEGVITPCHTEPVEVGKEALEKVIKKYIGEIEQTPPAFSAKKINGKKAYELARAGKEVNLKPSKVTIHKIRILEFNYPKAKIEVTCGTGTYIRSLIHDLGQDLKVGAIMTDLERTQIGQWSVDDAVKLENISPENWTNYLFKFNPVEKGD